MQLLKDFTIAFFCFTGIIGAVINIITTVKWTLEKDITARMIRKCIKEGKANIISREELESGRKTNHERIVNECDKED